MLGAPPAFVLSQDQTLYKWYLITYKVLNLCNFSDTIACVLSNYLFLELFIVFFPNTFKVPQVSVLFNFQGPVPTVSRGQLVYYISFSSVCQELFWRFFWSRPAVRPVLLEAAFLIKTAYSFYLIQSLLSRTFFEVFCRASDGLTKGFHRVTEPPAIRSISRYVRFVAFFQGLSFATAWL